MQKKIGLIDVDEIAKNERVLPIEGYGGKYLVSESGKVISVYRHTNIHGVIVRLNKTILLKPSPDSKGYLNVNLFDDQGKYKTVKVHRLVAGAFLDNPLHKRCVCHKDNNPQNNHVDNLYWGTDKENQAQAWEDGLHKNRIPVKQIDKTGMTVAIFKSLSEAAREKNISQQNIQKCIYGKRKSAGGYIWQKLD